MEDFFSIENWPSMLFLSFSADKKQILKPAKRKTGILARGLRFPTNRTGPFRNTHGKYRSIHRKRVSRNVACHFLQCIRKTREPDLDELL